MSHTCRCGASWTGTNMAHCGVGGCHRTFATVSAFDMHRRAGWCHNPESEIHGRGNLKGQPVFVVNRHGHWALNTGPKPEFWKDKAA